MSYTPTETVGSTKYIRMGMVHSIVGAMIGSFVHPLLIQTHVNQKLN